MDDGVVYPANPLIENYDRSRLKHAPFFFDRDDWLGIGDAIGISLHDRLKLDLLALCIQRWHSHFIVPACSHDVGKIVKCAKDAVRWHMRIDRPIWATDYDTRFCFDARAVMNRIAYVERHNERDGLLRRPWAFLRDWHDPWFHM